ncbi:MAG TPA: hypothetical protein PKU91_01350 [Phycisphaerales bacterium]|nr:hypothetical protein [Phycisphaerales bacterium]
MIPTGVLLCVAAAGCLWSLDRPDYPDRPIASDWCATGTDCSLYAAGDLDGDSFADVLTINGNRDLCAAPGVRGWNASGWAAVRGGMPSDAIALIVGESSRPAGPETFILTPRSLVVLSRYENNAYHDERRLPAPEGVTFATAAWSMGALHITDSLGSTWQPDAENFRQAAMDHSASSEPPSMPGMFVDPPPYDPDATSIARFTGDFNGDGLPDVAAVFSTALPHAHHVVRLVITPNPASGDSDSDGLSDEHERRLGTNPLDRDTDMDGLLDGWEVHGLPREIPLGERIGLFDHANPRADAALSPLRQDVICVLSYFEGVDAAAMDGELARVQALYRGLSNKNPDGSTGLWVHFRVEPTRVSKQDQSMPWWDVGNKHFPASERGILHWLQITPWGGGQSGQTADMGGAGNNWAVIAHEFGHQLSLSHEGDSIPPWCPLYTSLMNYAFSYSFDGDPNRIHFSAGEFRSTILDESNLIERLPYPYERVKYLANHPFRFTIEDAKDGTTLIDWDHSGTFDEGPVVADVNYGGSTHAGTRHNHEPSASGPALAYLADTCFLVAADQTRDHLWIKSYLGEDRWSDPRVIPNSGTARDHVVLGGADHGLVFHHHLYGWHVTRFDASSVISPVRIPDLPTSDLNACRVGDRVLIVSRQDNDTLSYRWLTFADNDPNRPVVSPPAALETRSLVTPGIAVDPSDGRLVLVTSMNNSAGGVFSMRVTRILVRGDRLWEQETAWTRGETSGNGCCARPVVTFSPAGQLTIFHQGGPDPSGQMIAYRTTRVGNTALDEGWLTCMMYDIWTRSRVPIAFAVGAQGAIYSYRWDAGGTNNMLQTAHNGLGIDTHPLRDFDDGAKISRWGIRHSILTMRLP